MNKEKLIQKIDDSIDTFSSQRVLAKDRDYERYCDATIYGLIVAKEIIQSEPEESKGVEIDPVKYTEWLENMVILLAKCYQETHDMLLNKAKSKENKLYFEIPTVQGSPLVFAVRDISELKTKGNVPSNVRDYVKKLSESR